MSLRLKAAAMLLQGHRPLRRLSRCPRFRRSTVQLMKERQHIIRLPNVLSTVQPNCVLRVLVIYLPNTVQPAPSVKEPSVKEPSVKEPSVKDVEEEVVELSRTPSVKGTASPSPSDRVACCYSA